VGQRKEDFESSLGTTSVLMLDERDPVMTSTTEERAVTTNGKSKVILPSLTRPPTVMCTGVINVNVHLKVRANRTQPAPLPQVQHYRSAVTVHHLSSGGAS
jgi:hypothetical protein